MKRLRKRMMAVLLSILMITGNIPACLSSANVYADESTAYTENSDSQSSESSSNTEADSGSANIADSVSNSQSSGADTQNSDRGGVLCRI